MRKLILTLGFLALAAVGCGDNTPYVPPTVDAGPVECGSEYTVPATIFQCAHSPGAWQVDPSKAVNPMTTCQLTNPDGSVWATLRKDGCCPMAADNSFGQNCDYAD